MTPRLAEILAEMVEFKLEADARRALGQRGRMPATGRADRAIREHDHEPEVTPTKPQNAALRRGGTR
jgi:hypothetical protein